MQFRTQIPIADSIKPISYNSQIVSLGSCFAVNIAEKLEYFKFQNSCNPFGILFHPLAIEKLIDFAVSKKEFTAADVFFHNDHWHSYDAHSVLSNESAEELVKELNLIINATSQQLRDASHIIITYGTAWVYENIESSTIVANCHKVPQKQFDKQILSVSAIENSIDRTLKLIEKLNPSASVIFTVSPVRHIKDGYIENQLSKSHLISAIHSILSTVDYQLNTEYFPSYEIMMDELRDYRFYNSDMLHPTPVAVDYIWERFKDTVIADSALSTLDAVASIQKSLQHRPFNPNSVSHQKFVQNLNSKISEMVAQYSFMKF
ncbi:MULTISPECIES: GSCFA domain-containing protein [unclassified Flavobacterium]|uniref:GSCFA domain-containing protein n=1 Tax=unclassified Flavobacterium TaxID=196869 RepID=UPI003F90FC51